MKKSTTKLQITNLVLHESYKRRNNNGKAAFTTTQHVEGKQENRVVKGFATSRRENDKDIVPLYDSIELVFTKV